MKDCSIKLLHLVRSSNLEPEQKLWRTTLLQALIDARGMSSIYKTSNKRFIKDEAENFLQSPHFHRICYYAGLDGKEVLNAFETLNLDDVAQVLKAL